MSKPDLLPCPFCGEKKIFLNEPSKYHRYGSINCPACLVSMPGEVMDQNELIGCWNARAAVGHCEGGK
jgi:transcription elongation factor Elf1